jgi:hypothetical protein
VKSTLLINGNSSSHLFPSGAFPESATDFALGSLGRSKRVFEAEKVANKEAPETPAHKKVKIHSSQDQNGVYIGQHTGQPLVKVFAKEKSNEVPHILGIDRKDLQPEMHQRCSRLVPEKRNTNLENITLDQKKPPPFHAESMEVMRKGSKADLVKALLASRKVRREATLLSREEAHTTKEQAQFSESETEGMNTSNTLVLNVSFDKYNPKVLKYAKIRKRPKTDFQTVSFQVPKEYTTNSCLDFSRRSISEKVVFKDDFKRPSIEKSKDVILSRLKSIIQGGKFWAKSIVFHYRQ